MEEIMLALPPETYNPVDKNYSGLCLRFSHSRFAWVIGYGYKRSQRNNDQIGIGKTPSLAVEDFIKKMKSYNG